jgi:hypothetical protein
MPTGLIFCDVKAMLRKTLSCQGGAPKSHTTNIHLRMLLNLLKTQCSDEHIVSNLGGGKNDMLIPLDRVIPQPPPLWLWVNMCVNLHGAILADVRWVPPCADLDQEAKIGQCGDVIAARLLHRLLSFLHTLLQPRGGGGGSGVWCNDSQMHTSPYASPRHTPWPANRPVPHTLHNQLALHSNFTQSHKHEIVKQIRSMLAFMVYVVGAVGRRTYSFPTLSPGFNMTSNTSLSSKASIVVQ